MIKLVRPPGGRPPYLAYSPFALVVDLVQSMGSQIFRALLALLMCDRDELNGIVDVPVAPEGGFDGEAGDEAGPEAGDEADGESTRNVASGTMRYSGRPATFRPLNARDGYNAKSLALGVVYKMIFKKRPRRGLKVTSVHPRELDFTSVPLCELEVTSVPPCEFEVTGVPPCKLEVTSVSYKLNA